MHPPDNMINSLISFVNSLIYSKTLTENIPYSIKSNDQLFYMNQGADDIHYA